jgi:glycosyltransferase involved in cell wall biosynthesis
MQLTVIISYYKALDNLKLILKALNQQSEKRFEVILSEDDFNENTFEYLNRNRQLFDFPITHLHQKEDNGFRKNEMLNKSIIHAKTDKLVFIDGDCVPHKHFVKEYAKAMQEGYYYIGRAVLLGEVTTKQVKSKQSLRRLNLFSVLFTNAQNKKEAIYSPYFSLTFQQKGRGLIGRNWGIFKKTLIELNGFDTDYVLAGVGEDADVEWRLRKHGIKTKSIKNKAIVYHLWHPRNYTEEIVDFNFEIMYKKQKANHVKCLNGIETLTED